MKHKEKRMTINMVVAANGFDGPDFYFCKVECSQAQYNDGEHYDAAKRAARGNGYDDPMVAFDENDPPKPLFKMFNWDSASTFKV
jgi:hypothetical protein